MIETSEKLLLKVKACEHYEATDTGRAVLERLTKAAS